MSNQTSPSTPKKRGAPLGNQNALTHGFYSSRTPTSRPKKPPETPSQPQPPRLSLAREISYLRYYYFRLAAASAHETDPVIIGDTLRTLSLTAAAVTRLVYTENHLRNRFDFRAPPDLLDQVQEEIRLSASELSCPSAVPDASFSELPPPELLFELAASQPGSDSPPSGPQPPPDQPEPSSSSKS